MRDPVVTGALTGIGRATALAFAREGARVVVSGRHAEIGQALASELRAAAAEAEFIRADDKATFITGQIINVNGGKTAW
jgi:NAD(P)-dependent dehydrogenase (short-subunit alcohol dehydrogenase family)